MAVIKRFEDLICWQKARELVKRVYDTAASGKLSKDYELRNQLRSAAISTMSNIAEGFARYHKKEFLRFLDISQSSASEVKSLLYIVLDQHYLPRERVLSIQNQADDVRHITLGLLRHIDSLIPRSPNRVQEPTSYYQNRHVNVWELPGEFVTIAGS